MRCWYCFRRLDNVQPFLLCLTEKIKVLVCPACLKKLCDYAIENKRYALARHLARILIRSGYAKALDLKTIALAMIPSYDFYRYRNNDEKLETLIAEWIPTATAIAFFS
jgi:hypothetical protein